VPVVDRLRDTPNWMRESYGSWKDCVLKYDRAPFEAADELQRLAAERAWVPVTERLPEKFTEVLVAFAGQITIPATGQWTGNPHDHNGWCYPVENNGICDDGSDPVVTHWMPLPEVPAA
jgi:hypothetical protein